MANFSYFDVALVSLKKCPTAVCVIKVQITKHLPTGLIHLRMHCPAFLITDQNSFIAANIETARECPADSEHIFSFQFQGWIFDLFQLKSDKVMRHLKYLHLFLDCPFNISS
jgi:hypothetical protein